MACAFVLAGAANAQPAVYVDVCVYGGTSGGVIAAVKAARLGKRVALICDKNHVGGMTSSGLGWTDIGHVGTAYIQGMANEFYTRINSKYGTQVNYHFEPHVAEAVFNDLIQESGVLLYTNQYLVSVTRQGAQIRAITMNNGNIFEAKEYIDTTYTGDLMAAAGVSYTMGREAASQYGESLAGVRPPDTSLGSQVNPYVISNVPDSGLLPLIQTNALAAAGAADSLVQTYNFRMCFTQVASNRLALTAPTNYAAAQYDLLARYLQANPSLTLSSLMTLGTPLPNNKMDINNNGPISTDFVGESSAYAEAGPALRNQIWQDHKNYEQGFFYFLANDPRVPSGIRSSMASWGPCKNEFTDNAGWPWELYVRESRRMVSDYVMTQSNVFNQLPVPDSVGMAGYFTDSHYCERIVNDGVVVNEGTARGDITAPYPVAYRALVPKTNECTNLLVPWSLSASHIAFCSIRMEPTFMILSQAAATAACNAIDDGVPVQSVDISKLQSQLLADGQNLGTGSSPAASSAIVVDDADPAGVTIVGDWTSSSASSGFYGSDYLHDGNTNKGSDSVTFRPNLPQAGLYQVYVRWTANANRSTNVPIDVGGAAGVKTFSVNQTQQGGQWVLLTTTNFDAGTTGFVRIRNDATTGFVIADAVQFVYNLPTVALWGADAQASRYGPHSADILISRDGNITSALTINLNIGGTATNGSDYATVPTSVILPPGIAITNLALSPLPSSVPVGNKVALISLAPSPAYQTGQLATASVSISDLPMNLWRVQYFGANATNAVVAGDNASPAGDGVPNIIKYALGLNPTQRAQTPLCTFGIDTNGFFALTYTRPDPPPSDINYQVVTSDDLATWCTNGACTSGPAILLNANGTATITTETSAQANAKARQFLSLRVTGN
ncbi:MAG TPA: FAD-dependent oxidoreductase [Verrucomicrobiae bacterium]|nr:FAD-dependent oxidoreductase [Verrucomicrobiae bacterium]